MELKGQQLIPASQQRTWDSLNDTEVLKACIPGCETLEKTAEGGFVATLALRIGPVSAKFKGSLTLSDVQPPNRYTMHFDGQGGMAGFGKGSAQVTLSPAAGGTMLDYEAKAQVGGKLAQVGSRLVDAAAGKITNDFFSAFCTRVGADAAAAGEAIAQGPDSTAVVADVEPPAATAGPRLPNGVWWALGAAVLVAALVALVR